MATYSTTFQCPETGQMVRASYAFGKVTLESLDDEWVKDGTISAITNEQTIAYCQRYSNARFKSLNEADQYIVKISDGQTFGFEKDW